MTSSSSKQIPAGLADTSPAFVEVAPRVAKKTVFTGKVLTKAQKRKPRI